MQKKQETKHTLDVMKSLKLTIFFFAFVSYFISTSCERVIEFNGKSSLPKIVVNANLSSNSDSIFIRVSRSIFFTEPQNTITTLPDAEVEIYVNGHNIGKAGYICDIGVAGYWDNGHEYTRGGESLFGFHCKLEPDDTVLIRVRHKDFGEAIAETYIPSPMEVISLQIDSFIPEGNHYGKELYTIPIKVTFRDSPEKNNLYGIYCEKIEYDTAGNRTWNTYYLTCNNSKIDFLRNKNFDTHNGEEIEYGGFLLFGDNNINGEEHTLEFNLKEQRGSSVSSTKNDTLVIHFGSYSVDYYKYIVSRYGSANMLEDLFEIDIFSEPIQTYSNVRGGIGLVYGLVSDSRIALVIADKPISQSMKYKKTDEFKR